MYDMEYSFASIEYMDSRGNSFVNAMRNSFSIEHEDAYGEYICTISILE